MTSTPAYCVLLMVNSGLSLDLGPGPAGDGKFDACSDHPQMVCVKGCRLDAEITKQNVKSEKLLEEQLRTDRVRITLQTMMILIAV